MKARLNKRSIQQATYEGPGGCYLWDTEMSGFGLRIYPSGRKYAHLADDPVRKASEQIGSALAATLSGSGSGDQTSPNPNDPIGEDASRR